ncbi:transporter [Streptomyces noboritoensis]|uniref:Transporter n=1 Tax=Streptomyces noboritoensis TaxID=67337 RepID=A0ABV6TG37_9ACTN
MSGLKLFHTTKSGVTEVVPRLAEAEADVQRLVEAHMEVVLGVRFLASEYGTGPVHGGRVDSLGLDENNAPVIVEYKRATDPGVLSQGLFYLAWLVESGRAEFGDLVRERLGPAAAAQVLWRAPRLILVAGDFTRYDLHAVRQLRHSVDLVRYRLYGEEHIALETVASVAPRAAGAVRRQRRRTPTTVPAHGTGGAMAELSAVVDEVLLGLGGDVSAVQRKQYRAYQRLRNFACLTSRQDRLLVYLKADPRSVELVPGFTRDVTGLGHHGTGDLEVSLRTERDVERARDLFRLSYTAA